ncbi:SDR family NAD(P)-dependent oxidoreductase [Ectopseudomonas alcaliphila]|uniref:NAD(P)-dependent dehydrogenase, short-chain alcohol dehydrogenase family n=1 Tax=Ectopseudomonas alcaliphila TaxID=101564 RepID=A0A1G7K340_9GAMM|nr:SDR family oxidoreductase [Pseudomonas alcaliphila]MDX5994602.1 SDR family oxidoreductase [Pseudomonas alcaliphila]SDF31708.1 NAD(P)-dependent dehydrogenase, short-chain alcohol dehydrogenase family [Pseudomonas alcaliphila]
MIEPVVLITGACGGVGQALVRRFRASGWRVFATDLDGEALRALGDAEHLAGYCPGDIRRPADCQRIVAEAVQTLGRIDALVNAAGVWREGQVEDFSEEDFDIVLDVNLKGSFFMCAAAIPPLKAAQGSIVNISSDAGRQGNRNAAAYCASKGGVTLMSKALALDLAPFGVRCNTVSPGDIDTPMLRFQAEHYGGGDPEAYYRDLLAKYPQGERAALIQPAEVAELVHFLCQPAARSITGADLAIDRGVSAGN